MIISNTTGGMKIHTKTPKHAPLPWELVKKDVDDRIAQFWIKSDNSSKDQQGSRFILPLSAEGLHHIRWYEENLKHIVNCVNSHDGLIEALMRIRKYICVPANAPIDLQFMQDVAKEALEAAGMTV